MSAYQLPRAPTAFSLGAGGKQKRPRVTEEQHLRWLRTLPCVITGGRPVDAAHIRYSDPARGKYETGKNEKPGDRWALPVRSDLHRAQHEGSERLFWIRHGLDPIEIALALWGATGDDDAAEAIIRESVARASTFLGKPGGER